VRRIYEGSPFDAIEVYALYQGTTSVVPQTIPKSLGFGPASFAGKGRSG
jgi:hypothetical protein